MVENQASKLGISDAANVEEPSRIGRRQLLKSTGLGTLIGVSGLSINSRSATAGTDGPPPETPDWRLAFDEQFAGDTLDEDRWQVGFGWGNTADNDDAVVSEDNVVVRDDSLRLLITHGGGGESDVTQGAINTKDRRTYGPGHYFEARMKLPKRTGVLPAFWAKPDSEAWPPELDFVELFQEEGADPHQAHFNVHYSSSGEAGDESTHSQAPVVHDSDVDLTDSFNVYGCAWLEDSVSFYFNGKFVGACTEDEAITGVNTGHPFYLMFSNHVNRVGTADYSQSWEEETVVDWCRVWKDAAT